MDRFQAEIAYYLDRFRSGEFSTAFHGLLEIDRDILPELMTVFQRTQEIGLREFLIHVIWETREPTVIPFLGDALSDEEPRIWRRALDGLVAIASQHSLDQLRAARTRRFPTQPETHEFRRWLEEAIRQTEEALNQR